jgi:hypothetical protein
MITTHLTGGRRPNPRAVRALTPKAPSDDGHVAYGELWLLYQEYQVYASLRQRALLDAARPQVKRRQAA